MLKRNWGLFVAIGVSLAVSAWLYVSLQPRQPDLPVYEYGKGSAPSYQEGGRDCQPAVLATVRDRGEAARQSDRCAEEAEEHRLKSDDLVQQTRAADAAQAQAWSAYQLGWLGLYGTIGGFLTLVAAAAAAIYAREAARAANASLSHAQDVSEAELRPWLHVEVNVTRFLTSEKQASISYVIVVKNIGKTVAKDIEFEARMFVFGPENQTEIPDFFDHPFERQQRTFTAMRTLLPQADTTYRSVAARPLAELVEVFDEHNRRIAHPILAVNVLYGWGGKSGGRTSQAFHITYVGNAFIMDVQHRYNEQAGMRIRSGGDYSRVS